jgi:hypothetical protein
MEKRQAILQTSLLLDAIPKKAVHAARARLAYVVLSMMAQLEHSFKRNVARTT